MPLYSLPQNELLLKHINDANPKTVQALTPAIARFSKPAATAVDPETGNNAVVRVHAIQGKGYVGSYPQPYRRIELQTLFKNIDVVCTLPGINRIRQAIPNLNGRYGLNLIADEVGDGWLYNGRYFVLQVMDTSLQYTGSVRVLWRPDRYKLETLVIQPNMDALTWPVETDKLSGKMLSYGLDFTEYRTQIEAIRSGKTLNSPEAIASNATDTLLAIMEQYGIPRFDYTGARITRKTVKSVTDANPMYTNVAVISGIVDPYLSGDIYLHYNT